MLILGYAFAIRSERLLCREVQVNLAYRWFCGLSIEDKIPDHSAFSRARNERFRDSDIFRRVFERVVEACIAAGLVGGEGFAVDASLIAADANKQRSKGPVLATTGLSRMELEPTGRKPEVSIAPLTGDTRLPFIGDARLPPPSLSATACAPPVQAWHAARSRAVAAAS
jgi:hypothetical protein